MNVYDHITDRIIAQLEQGVAPWRSPYFKDVGFPRNFATGKFYSGINVFLLACSGFPSPYFLTFLQAKDLGGNVRKGEKGTQIVKCGTWKPEDEVAADEAVTRHYLKGYTVFNSTQIEGIEFPAIETHTFAETESTDRARAIVSAMPSAPPILFDNAYPCYRPKSDSVHMPARASFIAESAYYSTLFHELAHSTGHSSRLARQSLLDNKGIHATGEARKVYCEEELVAEMAACFLNAEAGIVEMEIDNSAAYLQSWLTVLKTKDARSWIIRAASQSHKAANFILAREAETTSIAV